jgi:hypothetical protein
MNFRTLNLGLGWLTFAIAAFVYISTMEPTVSFWDCGEFIATSYKLQVGHPPGAPMFLMIGRIFSLFAAPENVAYMVNLISALSSAFTILFLFWTISALGKKVIQKTSEELNMGEISVILGSALVGSLAYTFSDTFWFSAVEAEVYAMSSLFTAIVFWAILRWEQVADQPGSNRWLVFIAYMMGLSVGVHLLNLLAIPAITFVYYFKKHEVTWKGAAIAAVTSVIILGFVQTGIIPGIVEMSSKFELALVNGAGLPFNSGAILHILLTVALLVYAIFLTHSEKIEKTRLMLVIIGITFLVGSFSTLSFVVVVGIVAGFYGVKEFSPRLVNTFLMCLSMILIGYSSYAMILIRSNANPPMDENDPETMFNLLSYLNREQYGSQPILYGPYWNSPLDAKETHKDGKPVYVKDEEAGEYIVSDDKKKSVPNYASEFKAFFPRMWSPEQRHVRAYKSWSRFKGKPIRYRTAQGQQTIRKPTMMENMRYFFRYQVNWMYWRYFLWNFAGRQNDMQGHGNYIDGNWISGIDAVDSLFIGTQENLPDRLEENPAKNKFFFLPLILGILGLVFHFNRDKKDFALVAMLFLFTGLAIIVYLNQYPYQPRERDYAYAGSFYAYAIWIGLGVMGIAEWLRARVKVPQVIAAGLVTAICLGLVPGIMAMEGWDDHDRSNRYTARDFAKMYLDSCEKDGILFTNGDNDTFPLWYVQEVEEYRTDVRVINLSLLNTDWYINQMRRAAYDATPAPFSIPEEKYRQGTRDYLPVYERLNKENFYDVREVIEFIKDDKQTVAVGSGKRIPYMPTKNLYLQVDKSKVLADGFVPEEMESQIVDQIRWTMNKKYVMKKDMMILDLLANFNWDRPVYFAITTGGDAYIGLQDYFQLEGLAYRLVPFKGPVYDGQTGYVNTDIMYKRFMEQYQFGGMENPGVYMDENNRRMCMNLRNNFARLAESLIREGKKDEATAVLEKCLEVMPNENVPYNYFMIPVVEAMYRVGMTDRANEIITYLLDRTEKELDFYMNLDKFDYAKVGNNPQQTISVLYRIMSTVSQKFPQGELGDRAKESFDKFQEIYNVKEDERNRNKKNQ